jgi:hypothetical protein
MRITLKQNGTAMKRWMLAALSPFNSACCMWPRNERNEKLAYQQKRSAFSSDTPAMIVELL